MNARKLLSFRNICFLHEISLKQATNQIKYLSFK